MCVAARVSAVHPSSGGKRTSSHIRQREHLQGGRSATARGSAAVTHCPIPRAPCMEHHRQRVCVEEREKVTGDAHAPALSACGGLPVIALVGILPPLSGCLGSVRQYGHPIEHPCDHHRQGCPPPPSNPNPQPPTPNSKTYVCVGDKKGAIKCERGGVGGGGQTEAWIRLSRRGLCGATGTGAAAPSLAQKQTQTSSTSVQYYLE